MSNSYVISVQCKIFFAVIIPYFYCKLLGGLESNICATGLILPCELLKSDGPFIIPF